jgi:hypothetical protein
MVDGRVLGDAVEDALGAEGLPHHGHVDLLGLERLQVVAPAAHDVDDLELAVVDAVHLRGSGELQPRNRARAHPDGLGGEGLPVLDVLALAHDQAVVARADAGHAHHALRAGAEAERDVLRTEGGDLDVAGGERGARVGEALEHHHLDLDAVLGRFLWKEPQRRQRWHVQHALLDRHRLRQRRAQITLREGRRGERNGSERKQATLGEFHRDPPLG